MLFLLLLFFVYTPVYAHRIIVYYHTGGLKASNSLHSVLLLYKLNDYREVNQVSNNGHVFELNDNLSRKNFDKLMSILRQEHNIKAVEEDIVLHHFSTYSSSQWDMLDTGDNFQLFLNNREESSPPGYAVVVAVLDTGYVPHSSYIGNLLPLDDNSCISHNGVTNSCYGYTFISSCHISGIKECIDNRYYPDALDLGDYDEHHNSSWHGSHVTGIIAATTSNVLLGGAYGASILPIRVLGKGGGYMSDVANAILWAINKYSNIPNSHPALVINLSLGAIKQCSVTMQDAINTAYNNGVIVVAAAGNVDNDNQRVFNVSEVEPANCMHVISVSAKNINGGLSSYSSYGNTTITASGGDFNQNPVLSSVWGSQQQYNVADGGILKGQVGTSQAAPHVSAAVANLIGYYLSNGIYYDFNMIVDDLVKSANRLIDNSNFDQLFKGQGGTVNGDTLNMNSAMEYAVQNSKKSKQYNYNYKQWDMLTLGDDFGGVFQINWHDAVPFNPGYLTTVSVLSTGYTPNENFMNNLAPLSDNTCISYNGSDHCYGYTFISKCRYSYILNCKDGSYYRDALDFGDYSHNIMSTWQGTHIISHIVATNYNNMSLLGGAYGAQVVPVRVLGKLGWFNVNDIANALLWSVNRYSTTKNQHPAQVIDISVNQVGQCPTILQYAIDVAYHSGAIIIAPAGDGRIIDKKYQLFNVNDIFPANCNHVISVAAKDYKNSLSPYSNYGNVTITASGGSLDREVLSDSWGSDFHFNLNDDATLTYSNGTVYAAANVTAAVANLVSFLLFKKQPYNLEKIISTLQKASTMLTVNSNYSFIEPGEGGSVPRYSLDMSKAFAKLLREIK